MQDPASMIDVANTAFVAVSGLVVIMVGFYLVLRIIKQISHGSDGSEDWDRSWDGKYGQGAPWDE